jgi:hypothetical protein
MFGFNTEAELRAAISAKYHDAPPEKTHDLVEACVRACLEYNDPRPYPEYVGGDINKAVLRDFPKYGANRITGEIFNLKTGTVLRPSKTHRLLVLYGQNIKKRSINPWIPVIEAFWPRPSVSGISIDHVDRNPDNNALSNLRYATISLQSWNKIHVPKKAGMIKVAPVDSGIWRKVPPDMVHGATVWASEYGGWVRVPSKKIIKGCFNKRSGYYKIRLGKHNFSSHRLTCAAFYGLPPGPDFQANHLNGERFNPADARDLEWVSRSQNMQHAHDTGLVGIKRPVVMADGTTEKEFDSCAAAAKWLISLGIKSSAGLISNVCRGHVKTHAKRCWRYKDGIPPRKKTKIN